MQIGTDDGGILLLGASGKLGRMVRSVWSGDHCLHPVWRQSAGAGVCWRPGDPAPPIAQPRAILALWGSVTKPQEHPALALAALDLARALGTRLVVHCSSAAVYCPSSMPLDELAELGGNSPYSSAKREMEQVIEAWHKAHTGAARSVILRIGNVAGADSLFANLRPCQSVTLHRFADGNGPRRSYLAPDDFAKALAGIVGSDDMEGVFNLAAPRVTMMADIATAAGVGINWVDAPDDAVQTVRLDGAKLAAALPGLDLRSEAACLVESARRSGVWP